MDRFALGAGTVFIDTETEAAAFGYGWEMAKHLGGRYIWLTRHLKSAAVKKKTG